MIRLAILASHPIPYQVPLFRALAARNDVTLKVFFCWDCGVEATHDPGFGRSFKWDVPLLGGYDHELIPNWSRNPGMSHFTGLLNPTAPLRIREFRPDALIMQGYNRFTLLEVLMTSRLLGIPALARGDSTLLQGRSGPFRMAKQALLTPLFTAYAGAIASGALNARYYSQYGIAEDRIYFAPFTVDNSFFTSREEEARAHARQTRERLHIGSDEIAFLFAAKLLPHKGCADLIRAFGATKRKNAHLVIVGDGPERNQYEQLAASVAPGRVHFLGFFNQQDMPAAYAVGDVFVMPSHFEPWGLTVNEAMCLGLPVIASDQVGAVPDLVLPDNGWVFPAGNVQALTMVLDAALEDRAGLARRGLASRKHIAHWDIPQTAEGFVKAARAVAFSS